MKKEKAKDKDKNKDKKTGIGDKLSKLVTSRVFMAVILIIMGGGIMLDPTGATARIARTLGITIAISVAGVLIGFITTKCFNRENLMSIIEAFVFLAIGVCMFVFPDFSGEVLRELIFSIIIINSVVNLIYLKDYDKLRARREEKKRMRSEEENQNKVANAVGDSIKTVSDRYNKEFANASNYLQKKMDASTIAQVIINIVIIVISVIMLLPFFGGSVVFYYVAGLIMVVSAVNELVLAFRDYRDKKSRSLEEDL